MRVVLQMATSHALYNNPKFHQYLSIMDAQNILKTKEKREITEIRTPMLHKRSANLGTQNKNIYIREYEGNKMGTFLIPNKAS